MPDYNFLPLLLPFFIALTTFDDCEGQICNKVAPTLLNPTKYNCRNGKSFCYPNVLSYTETDQTDAPIQRKPSRRFSIIPNAMPLKSTEAWCTTGKPEAVGHFKKQFLDEPSAYLDDHLPMFVDLVGGLWGQDAECGKSQNLTTSGAANTTKSIGTKATTTQKSVGTKYPTTSPTTSATTTTSSTIKSTEKKTMKSTSMTTTKSTHKTTPKKPKGCVAGWEYVIAAKFLDRFQALQLENPDCVRKCGRKMKKQRVLNHAVRVGFLEKPAETEAPYEFKQLKESVAKGIPYEPGYKILKEDYIMKKLEDSSARDLKATMDYDYLDIPMEDHQTELVIEVRVHNCSGGITFVSAARKMIDEDKMWQNSEIKIKNHEFWRNWSKDFTFLDNCCYKWDEIFYHKYDTAEIITKDVWPENMDATIEKVKFGYELPGDKTPTPEQQLAAKYKYGLSLAERPRFRNKYPNKANVMLPFTDGLFIAPPKLSVKPPQEYKVNIQFYYGGQKLDNQIKLQIRQYVISCVCTTAEDGYDGLMRELKFHVPRIYAAVIDNENTTPKHRDPNSVDIIDSVKVGERSRMTKAFETELNLYNETEWKDNI